MKRSKECRRAARSNGSRCSFWLWKEDLDLWPAGYELRPGKYFNSTERFCVFPSWDGNAVGRCLLQRSVPVWNSYEPQFRSDKPAISKEEMRNGLDRPLARAEGSLEPFLPDPHSFGWSGHLKSYRDVAAAGHM